ncbi:MAG: amidase [Planctomycetes bacterium]|nr:amidase [Planctomycetota bacterium]
MDRRSFLLAAGAAPLASCLAPDDADDMAAFARLTGLGFRDEERAQAAGQLAALRSDYAALRSVSPPFELPPCCHFDPHASTHPGATRPTATGPNAAAATAGDAALPADDRDLAFASVWELASLLQQGKVTSRRLTELSIARLRRFDPDLLCVVTLLADEALARADQLDAERKVGRVRGPLHGIPYGAKDLFAWPSAPTTFGCRPFADHVWNATATPLARLHEAGAVLVAKLSLGALAMGDVWHGGRTRNPFRPDQGSSGSSAGSASAVAAGLLPFALGTETLGSIVSPCARCGVAGLRPSFGAVSRYGAMPLSWTMDKVGVIARTAIDAGLVFDAIRGTDGRDPAARDTSFRWTPAAGESLDGLRFGVLQLDRFPSDDDQTNFLQWLAERAGAAPRPVTLPDAPYEAMLLMLHAEAAAAFDAFTRDRLVDDLPGQDDHDWPNQFRAARTIPAVEFLQASRRRQQLMDEMRTALDGIDVLVAPTHGGPTLTATNLTGHPTYVLPMAHGDVEREGGRPRMLALVGRLDGEAPLLRTADAWQRVTRFHLQRPALTDL